MLAYLSKRLTFVHFLDCLFQVFQSQDQYSDIVEGATSGGLAESDLYTFSRRYMFVVIKLLLGARVFAFMTISLALVVW